MRIELYKGGSSSRFGGAFDYVRLERIGRRRETVKRSAQIEATIATDAHDAPPRVTELSIRVDPSEAIDAEMLRQVMPAFLSYIDESHARNHEVVPEGTPLTDLASFMQATPQYETTLKGIRRQRRRRDLTPAFIRDVANTYNEAIDKGVPTTEYLMRHYQAERQTVDRWVGLARNEYKYRLKDRKGKRNVKR